MLEIEPEARPNKHSRRIMTRRLAQSTIVFWVPAVVLFVLINQLTSTASLPGDAAVLMWLNARSSPLLDASMVGLSVVGSALVLVPVVSLVVGMMYYWKRKRDAIFVAFAIGGASAANLALKSIFERPRPSLWQQIVIEQSYSFPSGHAMASSAIAFTAIALAWRSNYRWHVIVISLLFALLVSVSRLYLGVHYPSDIIGGWCASLLWVAVLHHVFVRFQPDIRQPAPVK